MQENQKKLSWAHGLAKFSVMQDRTKLENSHWEARDGKYLQTHILVKQLSIIRKQRK